MVEYITKQAVLMVLSYIRRKIGNAVMNELRILIEIYEDKEITGEEKKKIVIAKIHEFREGLPKMMVNIALELTVMLMNEFKVKLSSFR